jgi:hypothetical protein
VLLQAWMVSRLDWCRGCLQSLLAGKCAVFLKSHLLSLRMIDALISAHGAQVAPSGHPLGGANL